jgi:hypothetical protein
VMQEQAVSRIRFSMAAQAATLDPPLPSPMPSHEAR